MVLYTGHAKKVALKNFANFWRTIEKHDIKFYSLVTQSIIHKSGKFHYITYSLQNWQNYISHGHLAVEMLSKIVSTIQDSANTVNLDTFWVQKNAQNVFRHLSRTLVKLFLKLRTALLIWAAENCPISSPMRLLIQKLFWAKSLDL